MKGKRLSLQAVLIILVVGVVGVSLLMTDVLINHAVGSNILQEQEEKGQTFARLVAEAEEIQEGLEANDPAAVQEYAERVRETSGLLFVVVMDMEAIRYSHPDEELIGERFVGEDEGPALNGETYSSMAEGTLSPSLRSFAPVFNSGGEQIGAVAVGDSIESIDQLMAENHGIILTSSLVGIAVGITGAVLIAAYVRRILHGQEPRDIARTFEERNRMLQSVREGVMAVDQAGVVTLVNESGRKLFEEAGLPDNPIGMKVIDFMPETGLHRVLKTGEAELDEELRLKRMTLLINRVPLTVGDEVVGAISTFRDKTEINALAEQLTGVKIYTETLRAQSHEMKNNLHVIMGMLHTESYKELHEYIRELTEMNGQAAHAALKQFADPVLGGFMHGKLSYTREKQVQMDIVCPSVIPAPADPKMNHHLITIAGNLIDNAVEAVQEQEVRKIRVSFQFEEKELLIEVRDNGPGLTEEVQKKMFTKGYSTKGDDRGYGLYLVWTTVQDCSGTVFIDTQRGRGTTVTVTLPYESQEGNDDPRTYSG
ncbi:DcuS/MalK family sensor histidine kinase [Alteribacter natronophilus]|uniref:DcuS/MalK family sensor histidine kinase n=1 Tax=Alteribacter natronophilus TaxID=2583810 RepID=UPI00110E7C28|nr:DcuS/MalK family sensor histidine kinase [Alteribacter natronophilus]TMW73793.1 two-component system sensor histidine kinase DcuS [Alteribacter natronophilus]